MNNIKHNSKMILYISHVIFLFLTSFKYHLSMGTIFLDNWPCRMHILSFMFIHVQYILCFVGSGFNTKGVFIVVEDIMKYALRWVQEYMNFKSVYTFKLFNVKIKHIILSYIYSTVSPITLHMMALMTYNLQDM